MPLLVICQIEYLRNRDVITLGHCGFDILMPSEVLVSDVTGAAMALSIPAQNRHGGRGLQCIRVNRKGGVGHERRHGLEEIDHHQHDIGEVPDTLLLFVQCLPLLLCSPVARMGAYSGHLSAETANNGTMGDDSGDVRCRPVLKRGNLAFWS